MYIYCWYKLNIYCIFTHLLLKVFLLIKNWLKISLANPVGIYMLNRLICILCSLAKQVFISADYWPGSKLHMEVLGIYIIAKTYTIISCWVRGLPSVSSEHENVLIDLLTLFKDVLVRGIKAGLECAEELGHEICILLVRPVKELDHIFFFHYTFGLLKIKVDFK